MSVLSIGLLSETNMKMIEELPIEQLVVRSFLYVASLNAAAELGLR